MERTQSRRTHRPRDARILIDLLDSETMIARCLIPRPLLNGHLEERPGKAYSKTGFASQQTGLRMARSTVMMALLVCVASEDSPLSFDSLLVTMNLG